MTQTPHLSRSLSWYHKNPIAAAKINRKTKLKQKFGLSIEQYDELHKKQNGSCAICKKPETVIHKGAVKRLAVDHCHTSRKIRGLLCSQCNQLLGRAFDDITILQQAIDYLRGNNV